MSSKAYISSAESAGVIECSGSVALARLLQSLATGTRARIVGVSPANAAGTCTVVIAGGLAEAQHAIEHVKTEGFENAVFFAKPDRQAMGLLLRSLLIAEQEPETVKEPRVRPIEDLHISEIEDWNVHELRRYARSLESFPIKGRDISKATRAELLSLLQTGGYIYPGSSSPRAYPTGTMMPS